MGIESRLRLAMVAGALLVLSACGHDSSEDAAATTARSGVDAPGIGIGNGTETPADEAAPGAPTELADGADTDQAGATVPQPAASLATEPGRQVILTGSLDLAVAEVAPVVAKVALVVEGLGGFLVGEQSDYAREDASSVLTVKVPPEQFRPALDQLARLGEVKAQNVGSEDVTGQVVDLDSRIATAAISVERLRSYLAEARTTADVAALEGELVRRESDLEAMRAQLRTLEDRVGFATIVVTVGAALPEPAGAAEGPGFTDAVEAGGRALVTVASAIALVVGAVLPWLPVALVGLLVVFLLRRRRPRPISVAPPAAREDEREPEPVG